MTGEIAVILGVVFLIVAALIFSIGRSALNNTPVHDGIGGKDTNNLMVGCLAPILAGGIAACGVVCLIVGGLVMLFGGGG